MKSVRVALFAGAVGCAMALQLPAEAKPTLKVLYSFRVEPDGFMPDATLLDVAGTLYGTTYRGGAHAGGMAFAVDKTGKETAVYSFCSQAACADGEYPLGALIDVGGTLYGTTLKGGANGKGALFSLDPGTASEQVLHSFGSGTDGAAPRADLIDVNGTLYGVTQKGGASGKGTVYSLDPGTGTEQTVYSFCSQQNCADGQYPEANLLNVNGTLYGTTRTGGANGRGTAFELDPGTGAEQVLYSFCSQQNCTDGEYPLAGLIVVNGTLYGTTYEGGADESYGTVFALDPGTGSEQVLYSFCSKTNCKDGAFPSAGLIAMNGLLFGTTAYGGAINGGTVFSVDPGTGAMSLVYSFCSLVNCTDGAYPQAGLINAKSTLYGTTQGGGASGYGTVFAVKSP